MRESSYPAPVRGSETSLPQVDLLAVLIALWRGKAFISLCTFLAAALTLAAVSQLAVAKYSSTVRLSLQAREQALVDIEAVVSGISTDRSALNTELEVVKSRDVIEALVDELRLIEDPEFNRALRPVPAVSVETLRRLIDPERARTLTDEELKVDTIRTVRGAIDVSALRNTYVFDITATSMSPAKSQVIANRLAALYRDYQVDTKFEATEYAVAWLAGRVSELEGELNALEGRIKDLRSTAQVVSRVGLDALNIRQKELRDRLDVLTERVAGTTGRLDRIDVAMVSADKILDPALQALLPTADVAGEGATPAQLAQLRARTEGELDRLTAQLDLLRASLVAVNAEIETQSSDLIALQNLERERDATQVIYETFLSRLKETSVQVGLQSPDSHVLSVAAPGDKISPRLTLSTVLAALFGAVLGGALVLLRRFALSTARSAGEVEFQTGVPVVGMIPAIPMNRTKNTWSYLAANSALPVNEAVRNLRTTIMMSDAEEDPKVILVTSSVPKEGKTTNCVALALNFAGLRKRVLLVDGDIRRRSLTSIYGQRSDHGIVSVIEGKVSLSKAVLTDPASGVDILPGEASSRNAADLFAFEEFADFFADLRQIYDVVIVDTPPVLVVPDARILAAHCDRMLYTVRWDRTPMSQVEEGLRLFRSAGRVADGLILSRIPKGGAAGYDYARGYGSVPLGGRSRQPY